MLSADRLEAQTEELRRVLFGGPSADGGRGEEDEDVEMLIEEWLMKVSLSLVVFTLLCSDYVVVSCYFMSDASLSHLFLQHFFSSPRSAFSLELSLLRVMLILTFEVQINPAISVAAIATKR